MSDTINRSGSSIFARTIGVLTGRLGCREGIERSTRFVDDLGLDNLEKCEVVMYCEAEFGVEISDDEAEQCKTLGEMVDVIASKCGL